MCTFMLGNSMGCRKQAEKQNVYCTRHIVIAQMIVDGTITPADYAAELIQPPA